MNTILSIPSTSYYSAIFILLKIGVSILICNNNKFIMSSDIHDKVLEHFKRKRSLQESKIHKIESVVKQSYVKKVNQEDQPSSFEDFLRNEEHISYQAQPLDFRELKQPKLKVYFPGPPKPPPKLQEVPYTYEMVPNVPYKIPKQKKGTVGEWVLQESSFVERKNKSVIEQKTSERVQQQHKDMTQKKKIFRNAIKKLASKMRQTNLSLAEIQKNKGFIKKSFNYYNSHEFFAMAKAGDGECQKLLEANPYLAFDVDDFKMTALHWTAREGHAYLTKSLLQNFRANASAKDIYGRTPLHLAVSKKNIACIIRIFVQGGHLSALDNEKKSVRSFAPDSYTKYLLEKLQEVKFIIRAKGIRDMKIFREELEKHIKYVLDEASLYF